MPKRFFELLAGEFRLSILVCRAIRGIIESGPEEGAMVMNGLTYDRTSSFGLHDKTWKFDETLRDIEFFKSTVNSNKLFATSNTPIRFRRLNHDDFTRNASTHFFNLTVCERTNRGFSNLEILCPGTRLFVRISV